jgi:hypothetical protein
MKKINSLALAFGSAALLVASFAQANTVTPLSPLPAGSYGDPSLATLVVDQSGATLELPCANVAFGEINYNASNGKFSVEGEETSNLPSRHATATPVVLTGTVSKCEPDGVCRTTPAYITATLSNAQTGVVIGHYAFQIDVNGVGVRCE